MINANIMIGIRYVPLFIFEEFDAVVVVVIFCVSGLYCITVVGVVFMVVVD